MQNLRGVIKFFTFILLFACFFQLTFTFVALHVESNADKYASAHVKEAPAQASVIEKDSIDQIKKRFRREFLDSVSGASTIPKVPLLNELYTYKFASDHSLTLGLDLKGGMSLIMEIAEDDVLIDLSGKNNNTAFRQAIVNAKKAQASNQSDFLTLFKSEFEKANPGAKLAPIFAGVETYRGKINPASTTNDEVIALLRKDFNSAVRETFNVLKTRIDQFGVASPNISLQENTGRIILELPGVDDPVRVRKLLQQTAQLEFWRTFDASEVAPTLDLVYARIKATADTAKNEPETTVDTDTSSAANFGLNNNDTTKVKTDTGSAAKTTKVKDKKDEEINPLARVFSVNLTADRKSFNQGPAVGFALGKDTAKVNHYFGREDIRTLFPRDMKFLWAAKPSKENYFALYAIQMDRTSTEPALKGDVITDATKGFDQNGIPQVELFMNTTGATTWEKLTDEAANAVVPGKQGTIKKSIAIVLDNRVFSAPQVHGKIAGGRSQITGIDGIDEADDLANILKSGKLEAKTKVIQEQVIGPSLGKESVKAGLLSLFIGVLLVFLFMVGYYSSSGVIANIAMFLNLFIQICVLIGLGASFTLPAMAGIVLTLAMAVDANVIINERVREEVARGKGLRLAVDEGYKHSYSAILDGNLTTIAIAVVLTVFGLGPIKGFGLVLFSGLLISMFTAVLVSRVIFDWAFDRNINIHFGNKYTMNLLKGINFDFIGQRKITYGISTVVFIICLSSMLFYGFDLGVDFRGGRSYVVQFDKDVKTEEVATTLEKSLGGLPQVKTYGSNNQISITTAYKIDTAGATADSLVESALYTGLKPFYSQYPTEDDFRTKNVKSSIKISATVADDIRNSSYKAVLFGLLFVFLYIFIRFKRWEYATGAIVALVHDPIIILGLFSLLRKVIPFSLEIDQTVVAAVLTLIGYSVNDTVVVFDRIRETLGLHPTRTLIQNVNDSINQTLSRTIMTVVTVFLVALILFIFGGTPIRGFSFALILGLLIGTYSSVFVAAPIMVDLMNRKKDTK